MLVAPGCQVWLDVFVPNGDVLAETDIGRSFYWLGQAFADAIAKVLGLPADQAGVEVHAVPPKRHRGPRCFVMPVLVRER